MEGTEFKPGDRVYVDDEGLATMRRLLPKMPPNNEGTIESIDGDTAIIIFDQGGVEAAGNAAPYNLAEVHHLGSH